MEQLAVADRRLVLPKRNPLRTQEFEPHVRSAHIDPGFVGEVPLEHVGSFSRRSDNVKRAPSAIEVILMLEHPKARPISSGSSECDRPEDDEKNEAICHADRLTRSSTATPKAFASWLQCLVRRVTASCSRIVRIEMTALQRAKISKLSRMSRTLRSILRQQSALQKRR
jgi:hypothetical protein